MVVNVTRNKIYIENGEGVHLCSAWDDRTLCGDAMEGDPENGIEPVTNSKSRIVTCKACIEVIKLCRNVRISE